MNNVNVNVIINIIIIISAAAIFCSCYLNNENNSVYIYNIIFCIILAHHSLDPYLHNYFSWTTTTKNVFPQCGGSGAE